MQKGIDGKADLMYPECGRTELKGVLSMATTRTWCVFAGLLLFVGNAFAQGAQLTVTTTPDFPLYRGEYVPVDIAVTIPPDAPEAPRALAVLLNPSATVLLRRTIPNPIWPDDEGEALPWDDNFFLSPTRDSSGFYAISWVNPPAASFRVRLYLQLDQSQADRLSIEHYAITRYGGEPIESPRETVDTVWRPRRHDADTTSPSWEISLGELLRSIQFYNSPGLHCEDGTEDGYAPGPGDQTCRYYDLDYAPGDWRVSLSELLRLIQFYNMGGYFPYMGTEDDYAGIVDPSRVVADPPIVGPGQTTTLTVDYYYAIELQSMTAVDYKGDYLGDVEFVSQDGPRKYTYQFTSPGGYTGQVLLRTTATGWYGLTLDGYTKGALEMDSTPPAIDVTGPFVESLSNPYFRVAIYDNTATINLDDDHIGVQTTGSINCELSIEPEADAPGIYRLYLNDCQNVGNIAIYLLAGAAVDPYGNASAQTPLSNNYCYVEPEVNRLFPTLSAPTPYFYAGRDTEITLDIATEETEPITALGVTLNLPSGWDFIAMDPTQGILGTWITGTKVEILWLEIPTLPAQFTLNLRAPDNAAATADITAYVNYRRGGRNVEAPPAQLTLERLGAPQWHSSDYAPRDYQITLSELLRAIQFYTLGGYHCDPTTEDGYAPGQGVQNCRPHTGDYNPIDWDFTLTELMRLIQLHFHKEYHLDPTTEDGFAPGPPEN